MAIQFKGQTFDLTKEIMQEADRYGKTITASMGRWNSAGGSTSYVGFSQLEMLIVCLASIMEDSSGTPGREAFLCALAIVLSAPEQKALAEAAVSSDKELSIVLCPESGMPILVVMEEIASVDFQFSGSRISFKIPKGMVTVAMDSIGLTENSLGVDEHRAMALFHAGRVYDMSSRAIDFAEIAPVVSLMTAHLIFSGGITSVSASMVEFFIKGGLRMLTEPDEGKGVLVEEGSSPSSSTLH